MKLDSWEYIKKGGEKQWKILRQHPHQNSPEKASCAALMRNERKDALVVRKRGEMYMSKYKEKIN
jgi:hypothetical protein